MPPNAELEISYARSLFEYAPISLWEMDYSGIQTCLEYLRAQGITDLHSYLEEHPEAIGECITHLRVLDVNRKTLELFQAQSKEALIANLAMILRDEMARHFQGELVDLWNGKRDYEREGIVYSLTGDPLDVNMRWTVLPGYEQTLGRMLIAITDITARKRAEDYLNYLGTHDALTGLYNRSYFEEELTRLESSRRYPITVIIAEVDGMKHVNDTRGNTGGNEVLRRAGEVLRAAFRTEDVVARIGGDEFGIVIPQTDETAAEGAIARLYSLLALNNQFYQGDAIGISVGCATGQRGCDLQNERTLAQDRMLQEKRAKQDHLLPEKK